MKFGLTDQIIASMAQVFEPNPKVDKAFIFGSRAKGNFREGSDIDIAIKGRDLTFKDIISLSGKLEDLDIPYKIDLLDYHTIKEPALQEHIDRVGIEFYSRWKERILTEMGTLQRGKSKHRPRYAFHLYGGPYPFIQTGQIREASKYITKYEQTYSEDGLAQSKLWKKGTLCITIAANIAEIAILGMDACFPDSVLGFIPNKKKCDLDFAFYTLKYFQRELQQMGDGSVQDNINLGTFTQIKFPFPPLPEQTAIASILSSLDDKIDLLQRQNKTLEQLAETLFRQMMSEAEFSGFKNEQDEKNENEFCKSSNSVNPDSDKGKEAEESWKVGKLEDEFDFTMGQSPLGTDLNEDGVGTVFYQGRSDFGFRFPTPRVYTTAPTRLAKPLDTLVSVRAPVGDMNMAFENCCLGRGVAAFRYKHNPEFFSYTYYKLRSLMEPIKQFEDNGSVFGSIGKDDFKKLENIIPPKKLIAEFQKEAKPIDDKILLNETQIRTLTQTRDTLLPKLMSGEVRVKMSEL